MLIVKDQIIAAVYQNHEINRNSSIHLVGGVTQKSYPAAECYLTEDGNWTTDMAGARRFGSEWAARQEAFRLP